MSPEIILAALLLVLLASTALEQGARALQVRHQPPEPPAEVAGFVDSEGYARAQRYAAERQRFGLRRELVGLAVWLLLILSGGLADGYTWVASWTGDGWLTPLLFLGLVGLLFDLIDTPFAWASTFGIETRYGFNRTSKALFVRDKLVGYAVAAVLGGGVLGLLFASIELWGRDFWLVFALIAAVLLTLLAAFQTSVLLPLFNKLSPLPESPLRAAIEAYAAREGVALEGIFVMDGSKRSNRANAFFSGLGRQKKVVLYDTLIEHHPVEEVVAVLAHEVGHDRHRHVPKFLLGSIASLTLTLYLASLFLDATALSQALGAEERIVALNLLVFVLLVSPIQTAIGVLFNAISRRFEYQADAFAARSTSPAAIANAMRRFVQRDYAMATAHPLYTALNLSHPAPVERIRAIEGST
jgi:STE24 endopeptidase